MSSAGSARPLRIGTRASELALWQARRVAELVRRQPSAPAVELIHIRTEGDARTDVPLWQADGRAFFTREIDRAVLANEVDAAVHSLKDLPTALDAGLVLSAVLEREDPRDALLSRSAARVEDLGAGARVGTSSLRRRAFLARARGDVAALELRGNVPTRIERLAEGRFDAIILAAAGLKRLGLERHITEYLSPEQFTPAVSQGAIAVVCRADDAHAVRWLRPLDHFATRVATAAERSLLRRIEGGCQVPLGALARIEQDRLVLHASVCALDGSSSITASGDFPLGGQTPAALQRAVELGERVAEQLLAQGASRIIEAERHRSAASPVEQP